MKYNLSLSDQSEITLYLYSESDNSNAIQLLNKETAAEYCEAPLQITEGFSYEYNLTNAYKIEELPGVVKNSKAGKSSGRIIPGTYVGTLQLNILDHDNRKAGELELEVRSIKTSYREDYRYMLESIAEYCSDLVMLHSSPVYQHFIHDFSKDSKTVYQRFAFIKSMLDSEEFKDAIHKILISPITAWCETEESSDIRRIKRIDRSSMKQIFNNQRRLKLPEGHCLGRKIDSIPERIVVNKKRDTVDTPENRFIKHALKEFQSICSAMKSGISQSLNRSRAYFEVKNLEEQLSEILNRNMFRELSPPVALPLNSSVLQRKEGYREILRIWLLINLAANLIWAGGEDVYKAGKRDVAVLYEYWLFFELLKLMEEIFDITPESFQNLIGPTSDDVGIKLKSGRHIPLKGIYRNDIRNLEIEFSYNRTFSGNQNYPESGSWTRSMRPDYTLSIWPSDFTKNDAEEQELITHIHFDAKYRVDRVIELLGEDDVDLTNEREEQRNGTYKRADLLKMHAYKDAIRRTGGAYILYPGEDSSAAMKGFHEIIPGLGAFAIRPSKTENGIKHLKVFIESVVKLLLNRASQNERISYNTFNIFGDKPDKEVREKIPDKYNNKRVVPPDDTSVLIGYCKDDKHYEWITKNNLYNVRMDSERGSLRLDAMTSCASYLLLHREGALKSGDIWVISKSGPRVFSSEKLVSLKYTNPSHEFYLVYEIKKVGIPEFNNIVWDISKLDKYKSGRSSGLPFAVTLTELMGVKIKTD